MGIIVKVYLENIEEEIDIVTVNSDDKQSSSVTITANVIKDYLKKVRHAWLFCTREFELNFSFHHFNIFHFTISAWSK